MKLSIIIVNFNSIEHLSRCLESIHPSIPDYQYEVTVVDNASTDHSVSYLKQNYPWITLFESSSNIGFGRANNLVLSKIQSEYILLLNPDTILPKNGLSILLNFMEANSHIGVLSPQLVRPDGSFDHACRRQFPTHLDIIARLLWLDRLFSKSKWFGHYTMSNLLPTTPCDVECVSGAFMLLRKIALNQVGLFDERFWLYGEDIDLSYRFKLAGWRVYYNPEVTVIHVKRVSSKNAGLLAIKAFYVSSESLYHKYFYKTTPNFINLVVLLIIRFRLIISSIIWILFRKWV